ncbi:MAG TPA: bifunctional YncE family protein/alkaline phosphatase family protein [Balneolaceae bacterium]|nr:bifunctional YncE family protein/alkaline phosphatase family protein [Balneolaceae bacterium]
MKTPQKAIYYFVFLLLITVGSIGCRQQSINKELQKNLADKRLTLPNGWSLSPAGKQVPVGDLPLNTAVSAGKKFLAVTNNGYSKQGVTLLDIGNESVVDSAKLQRSWVGLSFSGDSLLYASGGNNNDIIIFGIHNSKLARQDSIVLGKPWPKDKISPAGLDVDPQGKRLYTVTKEDSVLYVLDLRNNEVLKRVKLDAAAYTCQLSKDGKELYISLWGGQEVSVYNIEKGVITGHIAVEDHPNDMALSNDGKFLFVANANSNSVSVIDLTQQKVIETLNTALYPNAPAGSTPDGVTLSGDGHTLYVANADNNCLAVFDVSTPGQSTSKGFIPTDWYPTSVEEANGRIIVTNGKGDHSEANPKGPQPDQSGGPQYIAGLFKGNVSFINQPDAADMATYSQAVYTNTPYHKDQKTAEDVAENNPIPKAKGGSSPIKHVFYIIKENRTYDQVLGDMPQGNGDSTLTLFGRKVTPNHHKIARNFVLLDNFYVDAEVSADGHNWSMGGYATDYVEKTWPTYYSGRGGTYDYEGGRDISFPQKGYIWNYCKRNGISYRSYGEFAELNHPNLDVLKGHIDRNYPGFDLSLKDVNREKEWEHDFDSLLSKNAVPQFQTIRLPNDHTSGAQVGKRTPKAYVADNDLALGRLIDHLSHSSIWKSSAVFVVEDDAQNGPDHVDAHRSVCLVISPYVKRNSVVHTMYSTTSVLHTMELVLGLPPMSQYDAAATPMYDVFTSQIDTSAYEALPNQTDLTKKNIASNKLSRESKKFNLAVADAAPDGAFDEVIWKAVRGIDSQMPAPRHSAFLKVHEKSKKDWDD